MQGAWVHARTCCKGWLIRGFFPLIGQGGMELVSSSVPDWRESYRTLRHGRPDREAHAVRQLPSSDRVVVIPSDQMDERKSLRRTAGEGIKGSSAPVRYWVGLRRSLPELPIPKHRGYRKSDAGIQTDIVLSSWRS